MQHVDESPDAPARKNRSDGGDSVAAGAAPHRTADRGSALDRIDCGSNRLLPGTGRPAYQASRSNVAGPNGGGDRLRWIAPLSADTSSGTTMASDDTPKAAPAEKPAPTAAAKADAPAPATAAPAEAGETKSSGYSRGEGQKVVTQAYKDNWNLIFGDKTAKKDMAAKPDEAETKPTASKIDKKAAKSATPKAGKKAVKKAAKKTAKKIDKKTDKKASKKSKKKAGKKENKKAKKKAAKKTVKKTVKKNSKTKAAKKTNRKR
jgi:hypothetical protein